MRFLVRILSKKLIVKLHEEKKEEWKECRKALLQLLQEGELKKKKNTVFEHFLQIWDPPLKFLFVY